MLSISYSAVVSAHSVTSEVCLIREETDSHSLAHHLLPTYEAVQLTGQIKPSEVFVLPTFNLQYPDLIFVCSWAIRDAWE